MKGSKRIRSPAEISRRFYFGSIPARLLLATGALLTAIYSSDGVVGFSVTYLVFALSTVVAAFARPAWSKYMYGNADTGSFGQPIRPYFKRLRPFHVMTYSNYAIVSFFHPESRYACMFLYADALVSLVVRAVTVGWGEEEVSVDKSVELKTLTSKQTGSQWTFAWLDKI